MVHYLNVEFKCIKENTVEETECWTLFCALKPVWSIGYKKIEFESDNYNINQIINEKTENYRLKKYTDTIQQWGFMFEYIKFRYKPCQQNACANHLARKSITSVNQWSLNYSCPNFLMPFLIRGIDNNH